MATPPHGHVERFGHQRDRFRVRRSPAVWLRLCASTPITTRLKGFRPFPRFIQADEPSEDGTRQPGSSRAPTMPAHHARPSTCPRRRVSPGALPQPGLLDPDPQRLEVHIDQQGHSGTVLHARVITHQYNSLRYQRLQVDDATLVVITAAQPTRAGQPAAPPARTRGASRCRRDSTTTPTVRRKSPQPCQFWHSSQRLSLGPPARFTQRLRIARITATERHSRRNGQRHCAPTI